MQLGIFDDAQGMNSIPGYKKGTAHSPLRQTLRAKINQDSTAARPVTGLDVIEDVLFAGDVQPIADAGEEEPPFERAKLKAEHPHLRARRCRGSGAAACRR